MELFLFALFAGDEAQLARAFLLAESLRTFGGRDARAEIEIYVPSPPAAGSEALRARLAGLGVTVLPIEVPPENLAWPYGAKVFAAARAEASLSRRAVGTAPAHLVWLDDDTVFLREPRELVLPEGMAFGWRPVMHTNVGSPFSDPPDAYWSAVYRVLEVPPAALFPMTTVADSVALRPYFNAGCLVVRPERGVLRAWAEAFRRVIADSTLVDLCARDARRRIFLHQAALAGAALAHLRTEEMHRLPDTVNYPLCFHERYPAGRRFDSIEGLTTIRTEAALEAHPNEPLAGVRGPEEQIRWLRERLATR